MLSCCAVKGNNLNNECAEIGSLYERGRSEGT